VQQLQKDDQNLELGYSTIEKENRLNQKINQKICG
jgi:hypothetical protein